MGELIINKIIMITGLDYSLMYEQKFVKKSQF